MPLLSYKSVGFEVTDFKATGEQWKFAGYASTFGNVDEGGDIVHPGAFQESIKARFDEKSRPRTKLLWQHDKDEPIGLPTVLREDSRGLYGEFKLSQTTRGRDAYELLKDGVLDSLSIGYIPEGQSEDARSGVRSLKKVDLLEISIVSFPMNELALISAVKSAQRLPLNTHADRLLEDVRAFTARYKELADLRARDGRHPSEAVRRAVAELKALAADLELPSEEPAPVAEPPESTGMSSTSLRLQIARRRLAHRGILEHAS